MMNLNYTKADYLPNVFLTPCAVCILHFLLFLFLFRCFFKNLFENKKVGRPLQGLILTVLTGVFILVPMLQTLRYGIYLPWEKEDSAISASGTVDRIVPCLFRARYHLEGSDKIERAYLVTINGTQFFCLQADRIEEGDEAEIQFYPRSRIVKTFRFQNQANGSSAAERQTSGLYRENAFDGIAALHFLALLLGAAACGLILALLKRGRRKKNEQDAVWLDGEMFYCKVTIAVLLFAVCFKIVPLFWSLTFGEVMIPVVLFIVVTKIPVYYTFSNTSVSKSAFKKIELWKKTLPDVRRITVFQSLQGCLLILESSEVDIFQAKTVWRFLRLCWVNRKNMLFLTFAPAQIVYATEFVRSFYSISPKMMDSVLDSFPLVTRETNR